MYLFLLSAADRQVWVFAVENMRNTYLKDVRKAWDGSKVLFGRTKVMAKALGATPEDEYQTNLHKLSKVGYLWIR
jgi:mRNA turnover protein 4